MPDDILVEMMNLFNDGYNLEEVLLVVSPCEQVDRVAALMHEGYDFDEAIYMTRHEYAASAVTQ